MIPGVSTPTAAPARTAAAALAQRRVVLAVALGMVALQTGFRAWASAGSWWYSDDFILLEDARRSGLSLPSLVVPHDSQLMPLGRFLAWTASGAGELAWWPGALQLVVLQLAAGLAATWMLVRVFGVRPGVLVPLALYLFSPLTLTAYLWWAAAVNQLPLHLAFFLAVGCHVTYVRTGRTRWAVLAALAVTLGMTAYVKAALVLPVLLLLSVGPFAVGGLRDRMRAVLGQWRGFAVYGVLGAAYAVGYVVWVPSPVADGDPIDWSGLVVTFFGTSLGPAALGGPWRWGTANLPLMQAAPPSWLAALSWVALLGGLAAVLVVQRRRGVATAPVSAAALAIGWLVVAFVLVGVGRAPELGAFVGQELRYLADSAMVLALALGLWCLPVRRGSAEDARCGVGRAVGSAARRRSVATAGAAVAVVLLGGTVWSSVTYVAAWHDDYAARAFVQRAAEVAAERPVTVADREVPPEVMAGTAYPDNLPSRMLGGVPDLTAVEEGTDLEVLDDAGTPRPGAVTADVESTPGPVEGCGYRVRQRPVEVDVEGGTGYFWWASISYLASADGEMTVGVGATQEEVQVVQGLHTLFLRGEGGVDPVVLEASGDLTVCVDAVRVGALATVGGEAS